MRPLTSDCWGPGCRRHRCSWRSSRCRVRTAGRWWAPPCVGPGPGAVIGVDEVSRALFAGCRGEVPLGVLIDLLAAHHGVDGDALAEAALPVVREAIGRGILYEAD